MLWAARQINPSGEQGDLVAEVVVPSGSATDSIATLLGEADVITNPRLFTWYVGRKNAGPWKAGKYVEFHENSSFDEAIAVLDDGPVPVNANTVRIPEGKRLIDALQIVSESHAGHLRGAAPERARLRRGPLQVQAGRGQQLGGPPVPGHL